jgi:hypothetical protein
VVVTGPPEIGRGVLDFLLVTAASNSWGDERERLSHQLQTRGPILRGRQARRLCHRFARVGVETRPERLQAMLAGVPVTDLEMIDVSFALIATEFNRAERIAKFKRLKRRGTRTLILAGLVLVALHLLLCIGYAWVNLTQPVLPY